MIGAMQDENVGMRLSLAIATRPRRRTRYASSFDSLLQSRSHPLPESASNPSHLHSVPFIIVCADQ